MLNTLFRDISKGCNVFQFFNNINPISFNLSVQQFFFRFLYVLVTLPSSGDALKDRDYRIRALMSQLQWQRGYNKQIINNFVSF